MVDLARLRVEWGGTGIVGPGVSTFYRVTSGGTGWADDILDFLHVNSVLYPAGLTAFIPSSGDLINADNGVISGTWSDPGTGGTETATGSGAWAAGVGARVVWNTAGIVNRRRVRGSTFLVPIMAAFYGPNGTLDDTTVATLQSRADGLLAAVPELRIWTRPKGSRAGAAQAITSATVPDKVTWLRSRRT